MHQMLAAADPLNTALANAQGLLLKIVAVAIIVAGAAIIWKARQGELSDVLGTVAIIVVGVAVVVLGISFATSGKAVGQAVLSFFGLS